MQRRGLHYAGPFFIMHMHHAYAKCICKVQNKKEKYMDMNTYQATALSTASYKDDDQALLCTTAGLQGELGEAMEALKKYIREDDEKAGMPPIEAFKKFQSTTVKELGDLMWYIAVYAWIWDITLEDICTHNVSKLSDRVKRGVLHGSGDER
jgi:NTP pyrophosphatase (non-canonical NTP hydrolase)